MKELTVLEDAYFIDKEQLDTVEAKVLLNQYISLVIKRALGYVRDNIKKDHEKLLRQIEDKRVGYYLLPIEKGSPCRLPT